MTKSLHSYNLLLEVSEINTCKLDAIKTVAFNRLQNNWCTSLMSFLSSYFIQLLLIPLLMLWATICTPAFWTIHRIPNANFCMNFCCKVLIIVKINVTQIPTIKRSTKSLWCSEYLYVHSHTDYQWYRILIGRYIQAWIPVCHYKIWKIK